MGPLGSFFLTAPAYNCSVMDDRIQRLNEKARALPKAPGVYLMKDDKGRVIYGAIDAAPDFYRCPVEKKSRSLMRRAVAPTRA